MQHALRPMLVTLLQRLPLPAARRPCLRSRKTSLTTSHSMATALQRSCSTSIKPRVSHDRSGMQGGQCALAAPCNALCLPPATMPGPHGARLCARLTRVPCPLGCHAHSGAMPTRVPCPLRCHAHSGAMPTRVPCPLGCHAHSGAMPSQVPGSVPGPLGCHMDHQGSACCPAAYVRCLLLVHVHPVLLGISTEGQLLTVINPCRLWVWLPLPLPVAPPLLSTLPFCSAHAQPLHPTTSCRPSTWWWCQPAR